MRRSPPTNLRSLESRIVNTARVRGTVTRRLQRAVANVVIGQMIPESAVRGGAAMKIRLGEAASRYTTDLDVARARTVSVDGYVNDFRELLGSGWGGFTGTVERQPSASPVGVPDEYIMQPLLVRLAYLGRHWLSVQFELGCNELGASINADHHLAEDLQEIFADIGLPAPAPVPVLPIGHQIAQKLHACTATDVFGRNDRARDLVDLQILMKHERLAPWELKETCERLLRSRQGHRWPPTVVVHPSWPSLYERAVESLDVLVDVHAAADWANRLIREIDRGLVGEGVTHEGDS